MTTRSLLAKKGKEKLVMVTAWDSITASLASAAGVDMILVGDSLANTALGHPNTLPVSLKAMYHHAGAVTRASGETFVVFDLPFLACRGNLSEDLLTCGRALKEFGCHAVKLESPTLELVRALTEHGIPVMGHLGLLPQHVNRYGGMYVQGRGEAAQALLEEAQALVQAGIFSLVLECVPESLGKLVTESLPIPTIGIGAGRFVDGQVQVLADLLGLLPGKTPKHALRYAELYQIGLEAVRRYAQDVRQGDFPGEEQIFGD